MKTEDFLTFQKMVTPSIIRVILWIGIVLSVVGGIISIIGGAVARYGGGTRVLNGIILLFLGPLGVRIYCELIVVIFQINDSLTEIKKNITK